MIDDIHPTIEYIGEITSELAEMARDDGLELLAFLLEMAALQAVHREPASGEGANNVWFV